MFINESFLFFLSCFLFKLALCAQYEHQLNSAIWSSKCSPRSYVLNECNWCRCRGSKFYCEARVCGKVDSFGHFNDAIQDIHVGMEGHGSWRSTLTCEPGVHYKRDKLLCVCDEHGTWPNPTCRDTFRVLHNVVITELALASSKQSCGPYKLYLIGCNVCFCPSTGRIDPELCTTKTCAQDDPVILREELAIIPKDSEDEVYAQCLAGRKYVLGCRLCTCLSNNRLLCGPCIYETTVEVDNSFCNKIKAKQLFNSDCNLCYCDNDQAICTVRRCLPKTFTPAKNEIEISNQLFVLTNEPTSDDKCMAGTRYKKDCNTCYCSETDSGIKIITCSVKRCEVSLNRHMNVDCVEETVFGVGCLVCTCSTENGEKMKICKVDPKCLIDKLPEPKNVVALNGHCEPNKSYKKDCNNCTCHKSGKLVSCSSQVCGDQGRRDKSLPAEQNSPMFRSVNIIPVKSKLPGDCPPGHSYKVDCNHCFCMKNGNVLCTNANCNKERL